MGDRIKALGMHICAQRGTDVFSGRCFYHFPLLLSTELAARTLGLCSGSTEALPHCSDLGPGSTPCSFTPGCAEHRESRPAAGPGQGAVDGPPTPLPAAEYFQGERLPGPAGGRGWEGG